MFEANGASITDNLSPKISHKVLFNLDVQSVKISKKVIQTGAVLNICFELEDDIRARGHEGRAVSDAGCMINIQIQETLALIATINEQKENSHVFEACWGHLMIKQAFPSNSSPSHTPNPDSPEGGDQMQCIGAASIPLHDILKHHFEQAALHNGDHSKITQPSSFRLLLPAEHSLYHRRTSSDSVPSNAVEISGDVSYVTVSTVITCTVIEQYSSKLQDLSPNDLSIDNTMHSSKSCVEVVSPTAISGKHGSSQRIPFQHPHANTTIEERQTPPSAKSGALFGRFKIEPRHPIRPHDTVTIPISNPDPDSKIPISAYAPRNLQYKKQLVPDRNGPIGTNTSNTSTKSHSYGFDSSKANSISPVHMFDTEDSYALKQDNLQLCQQNHSLSLSLKACEDLLLQEQAGKAAVTKANIKADTILATSLQHAHEEANELSTACEILSEQLMKKSREYESSQMSVEDYRGTLELIQHPLLQQGINSIAGQKYYLNNIIAQQDALERENSSLLEELIDYKVKYAQTLAKLDDRKFELEEKMHVTTGILSPNFIRAEETPKPSAPSTDSMLSSLQIDTHKRKDSNVSCSVTNEEQSKSLSSIPSTGTGKKPPTPDSTAERPSLSAIHASAASSKANTVNTIINSTGIWRIEDDTLSSNSPHSINTTDSFDIA